MKTRNIAPEATTGTRSPEPADRDQAAAGLRSGTRRLPPRSLIHRAWIFLLPLLLAPWVSAQPFAIGNGTVSGGGGASNSGRFGLRGTVGQAVAGPSAGGGFQLETGLWNVVVIVRTTGPAISAAIGEESLTLSWPAEATGYVLQETTSLAGPVTWTNAEAAMVISGGLVSTTLPATGGRRFFRLYQVPAKSQPQP